MIDVEYCGQTTRIGLKHDPRDMIQSLSKPSKVDDVKIDDEYEPAPKYRKTNESWQPAPSVTSFNGSNIQKQPVKPMEFNCASGMRARKQPVKPMQFNCRMRDTRAGWLLMLEVDGKEVSWRCLLEALKDGNKNAMQALEHGIKVTQYSAVYFECAPVDKNSMDMPFEAIIINAPSLATRRPNAGPFREHFKKAKGDVTAFWNLRKDAFLVCPCPLMSTEHAVYSSLAPFLRGAPEKQRDEFWIALGTNALLEAKKRMIWLNTAGQGVYWLHARLDQRPKYYKYKAFTNGAYYANDKHLVYQLQL